MAKYSIDSSTLTALGDAVRKQVFGTSDLIEHYSLDLNTNNNFISSSISAKYSTHNKFIFNVSNVENKYNTPSYMVVKKNDTYGPTIYYFANTDEYDTHFEIQTDTDTLYIILYDGYLTLDITIIPVDENGNEFKYTPLEMADKINNLMTIPEEGLVITGDCQYRFANQGWDWFITDNLTTSNISNASYMFQNSYIKEIPFELNLTNTASFNYIFNKMLYLEYAPQLNITSFTSHRSFSEMFSGCNRLKEVPNWLGDLLEIDYNISAKNTNFQPWGSIFYNCHSLRLIPEKVMKYIANPNMSGYYYGVAYSKPFQACSCLDELINIHCDNYNFTSNQFTYFFNSLTRVKDITFATNEDGTPVIVPWKSQTLDMTNYVGYANGTAVILNYNSGITADKQVSDDTTYQALKDDPDYFTLKPEYSRYTHASAVRTIASLPDCSATGTNTIKFKGTSGSLTDEGAINTLTEEEIAVATAKGWTISFT